MNEDLYSIIPNGAEGSSLRKLAAEVSKAGGQAVLVGGAVRDHLLGAKSKDYDVEVRGIDIPNLERLLRRAFSGIDMVGKSFAVYKIAGQEIDVSVPRTEEKTGTGHTSFTIKPDPWLGAREAAARRDYTINAIGVDLETFELIDPYNGVGDLEKRILRAVSEKFAEDPLRVLRGAQFAARFDMSMEEETALLCKSLLGEKASLSQERVEGEYKKLLLQGIKPSLGIDVLMATGWIEPELAGVEAETKKGLDFIASHANEQRVLNPEGRLTLGYAGLTMHLEDGPAGSLITRLTRLNGMSARAGKIRRHAGILKENASDTRIRRAAEDCEGALAPIFLAGALGGETTNAKERAGLLGALFGKVPTLAGGAEAMSVGMKAGPEMGKALRKVREAQLDGRISTTQEAVAILAKCAQRRAI